MARPNKKRIIGFNPNVHYFKPRGISPRTLDEITLNADECEAIRLADYNGMSHADAGEKMGVSRATFGRILQKARKSMAEALVKGFAIRIEGGRGQNACKSAYLQCDDCEHQWEEVQTVTTVVCFECHVEQDA